MLVAMMLALGGDSSGPRSHLSRVFCVMLLLPPCASLQAERKLDAEGAPLSCPLCVFSHPTYLTFCHHYNGQVLLKWRGPVWARLWYRSLRSSSTRECALCMVLLLVTLQGVHTHVELVVGHELGL